MKSILIFLFTTCLVSGLFAQFKTDYLKISEEGIKIFPYKDKSYSMEDQGIFPYQQFKDSISGKWVVRENPNYYPDSETNQWFRGEGISQFQDFRSENYLDVPPHLDSLADGIYAYYFSSIPIIDGDTLKFKDPSISALIPIRNNLIDGEVCWFHPDGLIKQIINYSEGQKNGLAFMQNVRVISEAKKKQKPHYFSDYKYASFNKNKLNGPVKYYLKSYPVKGFKQVIFEEETNYEMGVLHGSFVQKANGIISRSGQFSKGIGVGKWTHYQWKNGVFGGKLVLSHAYEINTDHSITSKPFFKHGQFPMPLSESNYMHRDLSRSSSSKGETDFHWGFAGHFSLSAFQPEYNIDQENPYYIPNCLKLKHEYPGSYPEEQINPVLANYPPLVDSLGAVVSSQALLESCGAVFKYTNLEVHYPNGQLRYQFDFTNPEKLYEQPVYYSNGKRMYYIVFDPKTDTYIQSMYDSLGKMSYQYSCDKWGNQLELLYPEIKKKINNRSYDLRGNSWIYSNTSDIDPTSSETYVYSETVSYTDLKSLGYHHYLPSSRSGIIVDSDISRIATSILRYQFSEDYKQLKIKDSLVLGKLWYISDTVVNLSENPFAISLLEKIDTAKIPAQLLATAHSYGSKRIPSLNLNQKPFSGILTVYLNSNDDASVKVKKNQLEITFNQAKENVIRSFIGGLSISLPYTYLWREIEEERWIKEIKDQFSLAAISIQFENGEKVNDIKYIAKNGYPLKTIDLKSGTTITYNEYPDILSRLNIDRIPDYKDTIFSFISAISSQTKDETSTLSLNFRHDTVRYFTTNLNADLFRSINFFGNLRTEYQDSAKQLIKLIETDTATKQLLIQFDLSKKLLKSYYSQTGILKAEYFIRGMNLTDSIHFFTETGDLKQILYFSNNLLVHSKQFENGHLKNILQFDTADSICYRYDELNGQLHQAFQPFRISKTPIHFYNSYSPSGKFTKYNSYGEVIESGMISYEQKTGIWNYYYYPQTIGHYQIDFKDTIVDYSLLYNGHESIDSKTITFGTIRFYGKTGEILSEGTISDFSKTYSCMQDDYTEQFQIAYSSYQGQITKDKTIRLVNLYPNGNKMNEGSLVNGLPEGLWYWYHSDGSLYQIGKYKNGQKTGRWLDGDLSKVKFLGETCLDPDSAEFTRLLKEIEITVRYYENGSQTSFEYHSIQMD